MDAESLNNWLKALWVILGIGAAFFVVRLIEEIGRTVTPKGR